MDDFEFLRIAREALDSFCEGECYGEVRLGDIEVVEEGLRISVFDADSGAFLRHISLVLVGDET